MITRSIKNKIVWSTSVQLLGKLAQMAIGMASLKLVTNALGAEEYGLYGRISEYALFFSVAINLGIFGNTVRKMSEAPQDGKLFINALSLRLFTAILCFTAATVYAWLAIPEKAFFWGVLFFLCALLLDYVTSVCSAMLQANYLMGRGVAALLAGRIATLGVLLMFITLTAPAKAHLFFCAPLAGAAVTASLSLLFVRFKISFVWKLDFEIMKMLFFTALPFGIINIFNSLYFRFLPSYFMAQVLSSAQYGSYEISLTLAATASLLSTLLMFSTLPTLKQAIQNKETQNIHTLIKTLKKSLAILAVLMVLGGVFIAPHAIILVSGKSFVMPELWFVLPLLLILAAISYFYDLVLITLFAYEQDMWMLKREALALALGLSLFLLTPLLPSVPIQAAWIIFSAIAAESTITLLGLKKLTSTVPCPRE